VGGVGGMRPRDCVPQTGKQHSTTSHPLTPSTPSQATNISLSSYKPLGVAATCQIFCSESPIGSLLASCNSVHISVDIFGYRLLMSTNHAALPCCATLHQKPVCHCCLKATASFTCSWSPSLPPPVICMSFVPPEFPVHPAPADMKMKSILSISYRPELDLI